MVRLSISSDVQMICIWSSREPLLSVRIVSCFIEIQIGFIFLGPADPGCPGKEAINDGCLSVCLSPFPSNRHHRSSGDCLEGKRENYQVCSVQYWVQQLYTYSELHRHTNRLNSSLDWVLSHWAHFTVLKFIFVYVEFCV